MPLKQKARCDATLHVLQKWSQGSDLDKSLIEIIKGITPVKPVVIGNVNEQKIVRICNQKRNTKGLPSDWIPPI